MINADEGSTPLGTPRVIEHRSDVIKGKGRIVVIPDITAADGESNE